MNVAEEVFRSAEMPKRIGLQQFMAEEGYYRGEIDGLWGPNMASGLAFMVDVSAVANSLGGGWDLIEGSSQDGIANLLEKVAAGSPPSVMGVYRFCDAIDVNLFDAQTVLDAPSFEAVRDKYGNLADAGCALFFVEGE
jgi:hypothetical protein